MKFLDRIKYGMQRFMIGRNGGDALGWAVLLAGLVCSLISSFVPRVRTFFYLLTMLCLAYSIFRMYSRNVTKRRQENAAFMNFFRQIKLRLTDREHRYFRCPQCRQTVRVPRGKGKLSIRCPNCQTKFERKS